MKKWFLSFGALSLMVSGASTILESFSGNNLSINKFNKNPTKTILNDVKNYHDIKNSISEKITVDQMASVTFDNEGDKYNFAFYSNNEKKCVYLLKTNILNGKTKSEEFFQSKDNIESIIGVDSILYIFTNEMVYSFNFNNLLKTIFELSVEKSWFGSPFNDSSVPQTKEGISPDIKKFVEFLPGADSDVTFDNSRIIPNTKQIITGLSKNSFDERVFTITSDGATTNDDLVIASPRFSGNNDNFFGAVSLKKDDESKAANYFIISEQGGEVSLCDPVTDEKRKLKLTFDDADDGITVEKNLMIFSLGERKIIAYDGMLLIWNPDAQYEIFPGFLKIKFSPDQILYKDDKDKIVYVNSGAIENNLKTLHFGTNNGQYKITYNSTNDSDIITDPKVIKISDSVVESSDNTINFNGSLYAEGLGNYYVYDPKNNNILDIHKKITFNDSYKLDDYFLKSSISEAKTNQEKVNFMFLAIKKIFSTENEEQFFVKSDMFTLIDPDNEGIDNIQKLNDFNPNTEKKVTYVLELSDDVSWININDSKNILFTIGEEAYIKNIENVLKNVKVDIEKKLSIKNKLTDFNEEVDKKIKSLLYDNEKTRDYSKLVKLKNLELANGSLILWDDKETKINYELLISGIGGKPDETISDLTGSMINVDKATMEMDGSISKTLGHGKSYDFKIKDYENFIKKYLDYENKDGVKMIVSATGIHSEKDKKNVNQVNSSFAEQPTNVANWNDFATVELKNEEGIIHIETFKKEKSYLGDLTLNIKLVNPEFIKGEPITLVVKIPLIDPVTPGINWAMIGGIIGAVLGAGLLGFLIFAFIKWWWPLIAAKSSGGKRKKIKSYGRLPQDLANTNARHNGGEVKKVLTRYDKGFVRSGVFEREVDANDTKFKNENYETSFLGYDVEEDAVVNNWAIDKEEGVAKKPRIAFEKKEKTMRHEQSIAKKMTKLKNKKNKH